MTQLHTTISLLKAAWQEERYGDSDTLARIEKLEMITWAIKVPNQEWQFPLEKIELTEGIRFALWALRAAAPAEEASRIGRLLAIDMALAGCELFQGDDFIDYTPKLKRLREMVEAGDSLEGWVDYAHAVGGIEERGSYDTWQSTVSMALAKAVRSVFCGGDLIGDGDEWLPDGGIYGAESGLSALEDLILYADPRYRHARTIADLAHAAEQRWQKGTRLDFTFCDTIDAEMDDLFDVIDSPIGNECKRLADKIARHVWAQHVGKAKP